METQTQSIPSELTMLFGYFPRCKKTGKELNRMWVTLLKAHPKDVVEAVLNSHRLSRKGDDPCISTVRDMLTAAKRQELDRGAVDRNKDKDHEVIAPLRAWAMFKFGDVAKEWSAREIVERRIAAEWNSIRPDIRPDHGTEYNTEPYRSLFNIAGVDTDEADRLIFQICGVHPIRKYDHMSIAEMAAAWRATMAKGGLVRDAKVSRIEEIQDDKEDRAERERVASLVSKAYREGWKK